MTYQGLSYIFLLFNTALHVHALLTVLKVRTKTVAQCVEFYYTYKKQVKVGRNGILMFGPPDSPVEKHAEAVVDVKVSAVKSDSYIKESVCSHGNKKHILNSKVLHIRT